MAHILVAGTGYVGLPLVARLRADGHRVTGLRRTPDDDGTDRLTADVTCPASLAGLPTDLDLVVSALSPSSRDAASYRQIFVDGTGNLLAALGDGRPPFIFVSSTRVYGADDGRRVDEFTPPDPACPLGEVLLGAEQQVLAAGPGTGVVRFSGIYGPGRTWLLDRVRRGDPVQVDPPAYTNRIHRDDCAGLLAHLASMALARDALPQMVLASDDDPAPMAEVTSWLAERLGVPRPPAAPHDPAAPRNKRCRSALLKDLGYRFQYPSYRDGYARMISRKEPRS
ncbi:MAG: NAD-dependent epimerase/dehydratase family protein [bacterium]|nr:NAD-dependent epimerase/dehydratase family protein [bacterium]